MNVSVCAEIKPIVNKQQTYRAKTKRAENGKTENTQLLIKKEKR